MDNLMQPLVGKRVMGLSLSEDAESIIFTLDGGEQQVYTTAADSCSETWFADIIGVKALLGEVVVSADEVELPGYDLDDGRGRQEEDQVYGYRLVTRLGTTDIAFRNSSNGYYGGCLRVPAPAIADMIGLLGARRDYRGLECVDASRRHP